ncbi:MAG: D-arabinose 1-dehydrogenase, Zn-dependent alcohol dehydrogenase family [Frankiales bacterium]|nr:D-arabinose 1-dehydrogenase, Zn-dependent alcohol dehydrogenase family [Frankiales bacterium]
MVQQKVVPTEMDAVRLSAFGSPEVLIPQRVATPGAGSRDVVIRVAYCGICRHDLLSRQGAFPTVRPPITPGHQISGHVVFTGADVPPGLLDRPVTTMLVVGCGECRGCLAGEPANCATGRPAFLGDDRDGGYAEYVAVPHHTVVPLPDGMDLMQAAVVNCTLGTAYHAMVRGGFAAGETVVVTGASGGVGIHAVKLLAHTGVRVLAVTSREEKVPMLHRVGADDVIVAPDLEFAAGVRERTGGARADGVLDIVGARSLNESLRALRDGGRVVVLGNVDGGATTVKPALLILRELSILGTRSATKAQLSQALELASSGRIVVEVSGVFPLREAARAHAEMDSGRVEGRVVLATADTV